MSTSKVVIGILTGIAVGAAIGVLLAPDSGENTRKKIANKSRDFADDVKGKWNHLVNGLSHRVDQLQEEVEEVADRVKSRTADSGRKVSAS